MELGVAVEVEDEGRRLGVRLRDGADLERPVALLLDRPAADEDSPALKPGPAIGDKEETDEWLADLDLQWSQQSAWLGFFREQTELRRLVREAAARAVETSEEVRRALGGPARVGEVPLSQSSQSTTVNGRQVQQVSLLLPVYGPGGGVAAQAAVMARTGAADESRMQVRVTLPSGQVLDLDVGGGGDVIDIDAIDV